MTTPPTADAAADWFEVGVYVHTVWAARAGEMNRFYKNGALPGALSS